MTLTPEEANARRRAAQYLAENPNSPDPNVVALFKNLESKRRQATGPSRKSFADRATATLGEFNRVIGATALAEKGLDPVLGAFGVDPIAPRLTNPAVAEDPRFRPERAAGQTLAAGVMAAVPQAAAARVVASAPATLQAQGVAAEVAKRIAAAPIVAPVGEAAALGGSALGAGYAEGDYSGSPGARFVFETAGALAPGVFAGRIRALGDALNLARKNLQTYLPGGAQKTAVAALGKVLSQYGEDPQTVINKLRSSNNPRRTAGQISGSRALLDLEAELIRTSPKFGRDVANRSRQEIADLNAAIEAARKTGDPGLIAKAAEIRLEHFNDLIDRRAQRLESQLTAMSARMSGSAADRQKFSQNARGIIEAARKQAKGDENILWGRVDKNIRADAAPLFSEVKAVRDQYLLPPEDPASKTMMDAVKIIEDRGRDTVVLSPIRDADGNQIKIVVPGQNPTVDELQKFYSRMRAAQRDASTGLKPDSQGAAIYGRLANAAMTAIEQSPAGADNAVRDAVNFTRLLHDRFSRGVIGEVRARGALGPRVSSGETLEKVVTGTPVARGEAAQGLIEGVAPIPGGVSPLGVERPAAMAGELEDFILNLAATTRRPDGTVDPNALRKFAAQNELTLDQIPGARAIIQSSAAAQDAINNFSSRVGELDLGKTTVARLIGAENPVSIFSAALRGDRPITDLNLLLSTARRGGPEARIASGKLALEALASKAETGAAMRASLEAPISPRGPRMLDFLVARGAMGRRHAENYKRLVDDLADFESVATIKSDVPVDLGTKARALNVVGRVVGAYAAKFLPISDTNALIAGSEGSKIGRDILENMPSLNVQKFLMELSADPQRMAVLLADAPTPPINGVPYSQQLENAKNQAIGLLVRYSGVGLPTAAMLSAGRYGASQITSEESAPQ